MTHIDNVPHILKFGITHRNSINANPAYVSIGNPELIEKRADLEIATAAGAKIKLGEFIPFNFYVRMPMLYNIQHGFNVPKAVHPRDM